MRRIAIALACAACLGTLVTGCNKSNTADSTGGKIPASQDAKEKQRAADMASQYQNQHR